MSGIFTQTSNYNVEKYKIHAYNTSFTQDDILEFGFNDGVYGKVILPALDSNKYYDIFRIMLHFSQGGKSYSLNEGITITYGNSIIANINPGFITNGENSFICLNSPQPCNKSHLDVTLTPMVTGTDLSITTLDGTNPIIGGKGEGEGGSITILILYNIRRFG